MGYYYTKQAPSSELKKQAADENMITKELDRLESEAIYIMREVASEAEKPVMLYSIGKDSSVMLRLAEKAFYPEPIPFPLMHIDTGWKFKEMIAFRDRIEYCRALSLKEDIDNHVDGFEENNNRIALLWME